MPHASTSPESGSFADFLQLLRSRLGLILSLAGVVILLTVVVTAVLPRWYAATATVRVEKPEGKEKLFQASGTGYLDPNFVQDQIRILQSAKILYPVIEKLGLNATLAQSLGSATALTTDLTYDYLMRKRLIDVESPRGSSLIEVTVELRDPALAAAVANAMVDTYAEDRVTFATSEQRGSLAQLRKELEEQERTVSSQRDRVEQLRKDLSISGVDLSARYTDIEIETLRQMQNSLIALSVEAIGRKTRYERFRDIPTAERVALVNSELIQDQNIQNLLQAFFVAEQTVTKLSARLGENHPDLIAAVDNRVKVREQLDQQLKGYENALEIAYKEAEARVTELKAQLAQAKVDQILSARDRMRPFEEAVQKLEDDTRLLSALKLNLRQREIDFQVPRRSVEILNQAEVPRRPSRPSWPLHLTLAVGLGLLLGVGTAVAFEFFDSSLRTLADVEAKLGRPVLAVVAERQKDDFARRLAPEEAEPYRVLYTNLGLASPAAKGTRVVLFTSAGPGEGKSTTLARLASTAAAAGERVLVIDGDVRRPTQHRAWGVERGSGVAEWVRGGAEIADVVRPTRVEGVDLITAGSGGADFVLGLLQAERLRQLLADVKGRYQRVLVDCPPVIGVSDSAVLAGVADEVVLVVQHRRNPGSMVARAQQVLKEWGREILGVVLNGVPVNSGEDYGYYTRNYAYYQRHDEGQSGEGRSKERLDLREPGSKDT